MRSLNFNVLKHKSLEPWHTNIEEYYRCVVDFYVLKKKAKKILYSIRIRKTSRN